MKRNYYLLLIFSLFSFSGFTQDQIIKTTKDTINCQIKEIGDDEVKYTQKDFKNDVIFGIDKNKISRILFSDGKELKIQDSMYGASQYEKQRKNALKVGFLSPLFGATSFSFEHSLKPGSSIEASLGIIGLGDDLGGNNASGLFLKFGYKFIKSPDFYTKGTRFSHILRGAYVRPEISFSNYRINSNLQYTSSTGPKETITMLACMINFGKQWVYQDRFLIDWFFGMGYATGNHPNKNGTWHYAFLGGFSEFPIAITTGIRIGVLF